MRHQSWHDRSSSPLSEGQADAIRAGDDDRDATAELLRTHHAAGRLSDDEFQQRLEQSMAARTLGEFRALAADLPVPRVRRPTPFARGLAGRRGPFGLRLLPVAVLFTLVWGVLARHAAWHHGYAGYHGHHGPGFSLLLLVGVAGFVALRRARYARYLRGTTGRARWV